MPIEVDRATVQRLVTDGAQLVEVLSAAEYGDEHLPGATNIPLKALAERAPRELDAARPVIVYCHDSQ